MKNEVPLLIPRKILLPLAIITFVAVLIGAWLKIVHHSYFGITGNMLLAASLVPSIIIILIVITDCIRNRLKNPFMWFIAVFFMGLLGSIIYLYYRNQIIIKDN